MRVGVLGARRVVGGAHQVVLAEPPAQAEDFRQQPRVVARRLLRAVEEQRGLVARAGPRVRERAPEEQLGVVGKRCGRFAKRVARSQGAPLSRSLRMCSRAAATPT